MKKIKHLDHRVHRLSHPIVERLDHHPLLEFVMGHSLSKSLNRSHTSYKDSSSLWVKDVIWFLKLAVLLGGINLAMKAFVTSSHVEIDPGGSECSHALALSLNENRNRRRRITSVDAPLIFSVSQTSKNTERCRLGSSIGEPPNWDCWTIEISAGLSLKLLGELAGS